MMKRGLLLAALLVMLGACAERWAKPGGTPQEFEATRTLCEASAYQVFPPAPRLVQASPGYFLPAQQVCDRGRCWLSGGGWVPPTVMSVDDNAPGRLQQTRACLFAQGWQPVENAQQAAAVTNAPHAIPATQGDPSFILINRNRRVLQDVFASPAGEQNWGPDRLGGATLKPGGRAPITLPGGECRYDLRLVWIGGDAQERRGVDMCAVKEYLVQ
jgi:hypothetical protein